MTSKNKKPISLREQFSIWFSRSLGQLVFAFEEEHLADILPDLFGYHILQYGYSAQSNYLGSSRIVNKTILFFDNAEIAKNMNAIHTRAEELPIATDSVDVIVLPHILEYSKDPHKLLREMDRVLIGDGHVVIIGINPLSLWGVWHLFLCWWGEMPWSGHLISIPRVKDWLSLLDFKVEKTKYFFFAPPFNNRKLLNQFMPLERLGRFCWPILGGLYLVVAKKRTLPLNPIKMQWKAKHRIIGSGAIEPSTRTRVKKL